MGVISQELSAVELARALDDFLLEHPHAAVLEDGRVLFDMPTSRYSLASEHGRCVLQLWSEERNLVRTVVGLEQRKDSLRLLVRRFGQTKPQLLHLLADRDQRTPSSRSAARARYVRTLEHVIPRAFGDYKLESLHSAMDLENSFGPAFARGTLVRGQSAWALIGVGGEETQATVDGVLTLGLLWLHLCRTRGEGRRHFEGLKIIVPAGSGELTQSRVGWLNAALAKWELYELDAAGETLTRIETGRDGNLRMKLLHAFDPQATLERMAPAVDQLLSVLPPGVRTRAEIRARSTTEVAALLHGLEFARVRHGLASGSFSREDRITFGAGVNETPLTDETEAMLRELVERLFASRHSEGSVRDPLFRLQPERWMESVLRDDLQAVEAHFRSAPVYNQVPAFAAGDRGMLDLLCATRSGRLAVLELKADDDLHMPLQGLDYWIRVHRLHSQRPAGTASGEFERGGYFPGVVLSPLPPLLYFVAPALRIHPSTEIILRYLAPEIEWTIIALNESWRRERTVVFRKRGGGELRPPR